MGWIHGAHRRATINQLFVRMWLLSTEGRTSGMGGHQWRGARPCAPTPCHHAWGVSPCHHARGVPPCHHARGVPPCHHAWGVSPCDHAWGVSPCAPNNRHQPIHRPDHRCPNAFTEPMTPIRRGARPCAPTIAGVGYWVAGCMGAPPCAPTIAGVGFGLRDAWAHRRAPLQSRAWGVGLRDAWAQPNLVGRTSVRPYMPSTNRISSGVRSYRR
jgi:hypothetical protein